MSSRKENTRMCCVCGSQPINDPNITLHRFPRPGPKNSLRCELWAKYCYPDQDWSSPKFQNGLYSKHKVLCSKHFRPTCFVQKKLFKTAVPDVGSDKDSSISDVRLPIFVPGCGSSIVEPIAGPSRIVKPLVERDPNRCFVTIQPEAEFKATTKKSEKKSVSIQKAEEKNKVLMRKMKNKMNKIYKLQKTLKQLKNESFLNVLSNNDTIKEVLATKVSSTFALLLQSELQNFSRKTSGRRWNIESKIIALRLYKRSPTCYKLLRRMICLPAPSTLQCLLSKFNMKIGPNQKLLKVLKDTLKNREPSDCELILMWDEMSIRKNLWYNPKNDLIEGFQDHAIQGRSPQPASYALVFMVVGIRSRIKQPIAYYLSSGSVTADRLAVLIKEVVNSCFEAGLNISASVCDMDGVNKKALGILGGSVENPIIEVGIHQIVSLFDTPHLLKCFRNLFLKYDIQFMTNITSGDRQGIGIAKWSHIRRFYELDNSNPNFVYAPSLTKDHLDPNSKQKMRVKLAAQVLSHSVAGGMYTKISDGDLPTEALATANLISNMDELFDAVNAYTPHPRRGKKYSTNLKKSSDDHITLFNKMKELFKKIEFIGCRGNPPSKDGWIWTLNGIQLIWNFLTKKYKNVESLSTRRLQQDPLENLFGCIRTNCGANTNPTSPQREWRNSRSTLAGYTRHVYAGGANAYHARAPAVPLNANGEPIKLPENLESLPRAEHFAAQRHRWNTNEEIAAILISFDKHSEWQSKEVKIRPKSGSMLLYSRKKVRYRRDGYCWKKRKDGKTTREDHMKLKVQGTECIYGCYVHSAILPTFHRRCYWLLQNPDIVLVHYLNVPYPDDNKLATVAPSLALWADKKEWTKDELVSQLKPMFFSEDEPDVNSDLEISTAETVEAIVGQLMEKQRAARAAALARQLECGCPDSTCQDSRTCVHPLRRIQTAKPPASDHHVSSTTGPSPRPMNHPPRQYTRDHRTSTQSSPLLLSLGQIQGGGGLLILNGTSNSAQQHSSLVSPLSVTSFVCEEPRDRYRQQYKPTFVLKREIPDSQQTHINNSETTFKVEARIEEKVEIENFDRKIKMEPKSRNHIIASAPATPSRYPDLVERLESKIQTEHSDDTLVLLGTDGHLDTSSGFFDETLELSHEDIQKTLSANMPTCELSRSVVRSTETANVMVSGIDTMDFIESCEAVASPTHVVDDNVFVNLDAFDMLGDFPELEVLDPSTISTNPLTLCNSSPPAQENNEKMQTDCPAEVALNITDYSPEWAYPEGGVKVLVAGPWTDTSDQYTVLFDNFPVPSILVQNGLLRCYCPAHEAGLAALQVARGGRVVSDTVVFEYKPGPTLVPSSPASAPLPSLDFRRFSLLHRFQRLHGRLQLKTEPMDDNNQIEDVQLYSNPKFEDRLVTYCKSLSSRSFGNSEGFTTEPGEDNSTILHLAAALGYTKLTTVLLRWKQDDNSLALEKEVNLGARDSENCTPLMVASAAGHVETAVVLARWSAGTRREAGARAAAAAARRAGHNRLAALLDRIHPPTTKSRDSVFRRPQSLSQKSRSGSLECNLVKRPSIDSGINMADAFRSSSAIDKTESASARWERSMSLPLDSDNSEDSLGESKIGRRMDLALCETARRATSPLIDVEALSPASPAPPAPPPAPAPAGEQDDRVFTLAEQIIAAMPERIKNESSLLNSCDLDGGTNGSEDVLMAPLLDDTSTFSSDFSFEFSDNTYRYCGGSTPCSSGSVSPGSALSPPPASPRAPLPSTSSATLQEFLNTTTHFSSLTLNDREQRELYSAAITIQKAYRQYRGRQLQRRAAAAAITIQNCYRRYKQFAYLKQMHAAATVIQRSFRSLRERRMNSNTTTTTIKRTYSQRRQNQAARKIQQFMRQSKIKLQSVRAESAREDLLSQAARPSSSQPITSIPPTPNRIIDYLAPESPMNADDDLLIELLFKM